MTLYARNQRVTAIEQTVGTTTYIAPLEHLTNRWRTHVVQGATIQSTLYEVSAFDRLKAELRSGDVAVNQSRRYGSFESSLIPRDRWDHLKATGQTRLAITGDAQSYLERRDQEIHERFTTLHQQLGTDAGAVSVDQQENLHLTRPEPSPPPEVKALRRRLGRMLPVVDLPDLLAEVQGWVPFLDRATHARTGAPLESNLHAPVLAALIAHGTNIGLHAMERASRFSYEQLASATDWYLHDESLKWMLIDLDHFLLHHPMSALWGDGTRSSSDGLRMRVAVQAANADPNTRYCDVTRGLTMYLHIADVGPPFGRQVFGVNEREYLHVLDAIYHHETELDIQEHSTDTAGGTDHLFALSHMLGLRFYPRLADILGRQYFTLRPPGDYGPLNQLIKGRIDPRPVVATWDDMQRVAASIPHGITSATVLMRQLQNQGPSNQMAQGFTQAGRLERTVYQLDYLLDLLVRDRVGRILARGELFNAMARACFFGRRGVLYERTLRAQLHTASCLIVMMAGCQVWTIGYLWAAIQTLRSQGEDLPDELLAHLSPTMWKHINLLGHYHFSPDMPWNLTNLRPLRTDQGRDEDDEDDERP
jgi:TnpA family transposase